MSEQRPQREEDKDVWVEEFEVSSKDLVSRVKELIREGNVRRLIIRKKDGDVLMEVPLTASVIAGSAMLVFTPMFAALGGLVAFLAEVRVEVVRTGKAPKPKHEEESGSKQKIDIE